MASFMGIIFNKARHVDGFLLRLRLNKNGRMVPALSNEIMSIFIKAKIAIDNLTAKISSVTSAVLERVNWLFVRLTIIAVAVVLALFSPANESQETPDVAWVSVPVVFIFAVVSMQFVIGIQAFNSMSAKKWIRPGWRSNPFNLKQPLQFFHFAGWFMLASSLSYLPAGFGGTHDSMVLVAMPASFGLGTLMGVKLSVLVYRRKFDHA